MPIIQNQPNTSQSMKKIDIPPSFTDALRQAENRCRGCKTSSPMICVERCDVWRVKNEILSVRQIAGEKRHVQKLLNALKNPRRIKILDALFEQPETLRDLQRYLSQSGHYHSRNTIDATYLRPLINAGLVQENASRFRITFYGRKMHGLLNRAGSETPFPIHSSCYEETVISELSSRPKSFAELSEKIPGKSLSRVLMRVRKKGLISEKLHGEYVFYHKMKNTQEAKLSPTEKRILKITPLKGISARQLSKEAKITQRRTYKYLRRLKEKKLIYAMKRPRIYELTEKGKEAAALLKEVNLLIESASVLVLQH